LTDPIHGRVRLWHFSDMQAAWSNVWCRALFGHQRVARLCRRMTLSGRLWRTSVPINASPCNVARTRSFASFLMSPIGHEWHSFRMWHLADEVALRVESPLMTQSGLRKRRSLAAASSWSMRLRRVVHAPNTAAGGLCVAASSDNQFTCSPFAVWQVHLCTVRIPGLDPQPPIAAE
jgi:hypothetical protein